MSKKTSEPKIIRRKITDYLPDDHNANKGTERGLQMLEDSLQSVGVGRSIVVDKHGKIPAGNKTLEAAVNAGFEDVLEIEDDGKTLIVHKRSDWDLDDPQGQARKYAYLDNRVSEVGLAWDANQIAADVAAGVDLSHIWTTAEYDYLLSQPNIDNAGDNSTSTTPEQANKSLAERFIVPPFSVLDARQGYWQERKRAWLALGLQSELGRGEGVTWGDSPEVTEKGLNFYRNQNKRIQGKLPAAIGGQPLPLDRMKNGKSPARTFAQDLMRGEHVVSSKVNTQAIGTQSWIASVKGEDFTGLGANSSGTSIFDPVLCELAYRWFSPPNGAILDPFAGGSVRGIVAHKLGRKYTGIDLRSEQIAANEAQAAQIVAGNIPRWITGDSVNIPTLLPDEQFDYIFSCPPYFDLEIYSDTEGDLSNTGDYQTFLVSYRAIIAACIAKLKNNRFACFVVGDMRDKKGLYRNFVSDTIAAFQDAGAALYNEVILVTSVGSLPIRVRKQFESGRKLGKTHQNVLVFIKGDPKKAVEACGDVEAYWPEDESTDSPYGEELHVS